jgi:hypothetical protein
MLSGSAITSRLLTTFTVGTEVGLLIASAR